MRRQLRKVLLTYVTRPLIWVLGGIYLIFLGAVLFRSATDYVTARPPSLQCAYPGIAHLGTTLFLNSPDRVREFERGRFDQKITGVEIRWYLAGSDFPAGEPRISAEGLRSLGACPKLRSLQISFIGFLADAEIAALGELSQLEYLTLNGVGVTSSLWKQLGRLPRLRHLDLTGCSCWGEDFPDLESLARLETLILGTPGFGGIIETDAALLPELHRLPALKTLVIGDRYRVLSVAEARRQLEQGIATAPASQGVNPLVENIDSLQAISTLQTLFVDELATTFPGFEKLQRELPGIQVRPAFIDQARFGWLLAALLLNALLLLLIAAQLHSQFAHPGAHLAPNYVGPHLIPPVGLWLFSVLVHSLPLLAHGVGFLAAVGLNFACWGIIGAVLASSTASQMDSRLRTWIAVPLGIFAGTWIPAMTIGILVFPSPMDWYLRGHEPYWALSFIALGCVGAGIAANVTVRLYSMYLERGIGSPPLGLNPMEFAQWQQQAYWRQQSEKPRRRSLYQLLSRRLEDVIAAAAVPGRIRRCNLWIAGNMVNGNLAPMITVVLSLLVIAFVQLPRLLQWDIERAPWQDPGGLMLTVIFPDIPALLLAGIWRGRRKTLAIESLRPVSRQQFGREIATALAWDLTPLWAGYLAVFALYVGIADPQRCSWNWMAAMLLVFVSRWILIYGLLLWGIVIRRDWLLILTAVIAGYAVIGVNITIIFLQAPILGVSRLPSDMPNIGPAALGGMGMMVGLVACLITGFAYRRWQVIELV